MKYIDAYEKIKNYILSGKLGESGTRLISTQELCKKCEISFVNTLKIVRQLKDELYLAAIQQKLYIATGLAKKRSDLRKFISNSKKIGLLIPSVTNPYFAELTEKFVEDLSKLGFSPIIYIYSKSGTELDGLKFFLENQCEGAILLVSNTSQKTIDTYNRFPLPAVVIGKIIEELNISCITSENSSTSEYAAKHLIANGYENFVFIHTHHNIENNERLKGFSKGVQTKYSEKEKPVKVIKYDDNNKNWKFELANYIDNLEKGSKVGIFCYHDLIAFDAFYFLTNAGYKVPEQVGIIGYDNLPISQTFNLTTCSYSFNEMVKQGFSCLMDTIEKSQVEKKNFKVQTILILRNSTKASENNN